MGLRGAGSQALGIDRLPQQLQQLGQFAVEAVGFRQVEHAARQAQPGKHALQARRLVGEQLGMLVGARQRGLGFFGKAAQQPLAQRGRALAVAALVARLGPGLGQQPARGIQGEQAPAGLVEFAAEQLRRLLA